MVLLKYVVTINTSTTVKDSFNVLLVTDEGTGDLILTLLNAMANNVYSAVCGAFGNRTNFWCYLTLQAQLLIDNNTYGDDGSAEDRDLANLGIGDLA
jgi:hypothetical protein